ncbi:MAG: hypothetical protein NTV07_01740 [Candidatus Omnitrophica bacterium]|nr:hypothetical protein [Candidatus Omnitrophota bacterium]
MQKKSLRVLKIGLITVFNLICLFSIIYCVVTSGERSQAGSEEVRVIKEFEGPAQPQAQTPASPAVAAQSAFARQANQQPSMQPTAGVFVVDDFEGEEVKNKLGGKTNVYVRAPSRIMISRRDEAINGKSSKVLMIKYDKKNTGGPGGTGGWCGYYTTIKNEKTGQYIDASNYNYITFFVKGEKGDENFMVGLADEHWDKMGDSLKSEEIGAYLPAGKITPQWQKVKVPLNIFFLDTANLSSITINFEAECFPEGAGIGTVFVDEIALEK